LGIFQYAKRQGVINSAGCSFAQSKPAGETHAYSLEEITHMLNVLPEPAATIVAVAAFTGVRKGELLGLWENYDGEQVLISRSFWRGHLLEPKTRLAKTSASHRATSPPPGLSSDPVGQPRERAYISQSSGKACQSGRTGGRRDRSRLHLRRESGGMAGMLFAADWRQIFTG
jgi:hypothetical protein